MSRRRQGWPDARRERSLMESSSAIPMSVQCDEDGCNGHEQAMVPLAEKDFDEAGGSDDECSV